MDDVKVGDRVELIRTQDPYTRLKPGDRGTVISLGMDLTGARLVGIDWDAGSTLSLIPSSGDRFRTVAADS